MGEEVPDRVEAAVGGPSLSQSASHAASWALLLPADPRCPQALRGRAERAPCHLRSLEGLGRRSRAAGLWSARLHLHAHSSSPLLLRL